MTVNDPDQPQSTGNRRPRPVGQTSGSPERPAQRVSAPVLAFDLAAETERLWQEQSLRQNGRDAKTLVKEPDLRVVLVAIAAGARIAKHHAPGALTVHTLTGHLRLHVAGRTIDLPVGRVLALEPGVAHDVEATERSAFLLTIAGHRAEDRAPAP